MTREEKEARKRRRQELAKQNLRPGKGAPVGNQYAKKDRMMRAALLEELGSTDEERRAKLREIARRVILAALEGDMEREAKWAIQEMWDRLDGKARQEVAHTDAEGEPLRIVWPLPQTALDK